MKIGFFGGCFNPPTNVHIDIANELIKSKVVEKVIFIPIGNFYKKHNLIGIDKRCKMLQLSIKNYPNLEIDDFEKNVKETIYAADAFRLINNKYKGHDIYFIMGSDNYNKINLWKEYDEIIEKYNYIIVKRDNEHIYEHRNNVLFFEPSEKYDFDSTLVRKLIKEGKDIYNYVNIDAAKYIKKNSLYI